MLVTQGKFLLKETILLNVKENKQNKFRVYHWRKKHPCSTDGTANMVEPYCVHLDIFFNLTSAWREYISPSCFDNA